MNGRRWPPEGRHHPGRESAEAELAERFGQLHAVIGDMTRALAALVPVALDTRTIVLDAAGIGTAQFRVPFKAVAVWSGSAQNVTLTSSPPMASAPPQGPGVALIPKGGFAAHNLSGYAWTIYGTAGDQLTVATFGRPIMPAGSAGP